MEKWTKSIFLPKSFWQVSKLLLEKRVFSATVFFNPNPGTTAPVAVVCATVSDVGDGYRCWSVALLPTPLLFGTVVLILALPFTLPIPLSPRKSPLEWLVLQSPPVAETPSAFFIPPSPLFYPRPEGSSLINPATCVIFPIFTISLFSTVGSAVVHQHFLSLPFRFLSEFVPPVFPLDAFTDIPNTPAGPPLTHQPQPFPDFPALTQYRVSLELLSFSFVEEDFHPAAEGFAMFTFFTVVATPSPPKTPVPILVSTMSEVVNNTGCLMILYNFEMPGLVLQRITGKRKYVDQNLRWEHLIDDVIESAFSRRCMYHHLQRSRWWKSPLS